MKIVCVVPVKLNNERLPGKNIRILGNKPLIKYILSTLNDIDLIDETYVYCSSNKIENYLVGNVKYLKREESLDLPTANFTQIFESFMNKIDADVYVYAHATAPFVSKNTIEKEIKSVISGEYDSSFTAEKIQDFIWSDGEPLNFDAENLPRSQDLPVLYRETSGVYVFTKEVFLKYKRRIGKNPNILEVNQKEMIDINYLEDFQLAERMLEPKDFVKYEKRVNLLDCTLRDGGCVNNFNFGSIAMNKIKKSLEQSNVDVIEIGYVNDKKGSNEDRTQFISVDAANAFLAKKKKNVKYVAMIDYGTYDFSKLPKRVIDGIDGIRLAFHKKDYSKAVEIAKIIYENGYDVFLQPMLILTYSDDELIDLIKLVNKLVPFATAFYIVDSFGQMKYGDCTRILKLIDNYLASEICIGFHGHNNLQLAYSNASELLCNDINRVIFVDSSLNGMGKGAGNVPTELIMNYLNNNLGKNYNLNYIYKIINEVIDDFKSEFTWGYSINFLLSALNQCTPSYVNYFINKCHLKTSDLASVLNMLDSSKKIAFDEFYAKEVYKKYMKSIGENDD